MLNHTEHRSSLSVDIVNRTVFYNATSAIKHSYLMLMVKLKVRLHTQNRLKTL